MEVAALLWAHGVGRVYELPIPLWLYLVGAAATVLVSFLLRILTRSTRPVAAERRILGAVAARWAVRVLRVITIVFLVATIVSGMVVGERGANFTTFSFWVGLIVGMTALNALVAGVWREVDPWATIERFYSIDDAEVARRVPPWWLGPLLLFLLFWFELVSGVGFDSFWVVVALVSYSVFSFTLRATFKDQWVMVDPLSILFGFAGRSAPARLDEDGLYIRSPLTELDEVRPMPLTLYVSVFVLLAATTFDNLSETVGWTGFLEATRLDALPSLVVDTVALGALALPFFATFIGVVWLAQRWLTQSPSLGEAGRLFGWSLVPIGIAYVLAHNTPLLITGIPQLLRFISDPFEQGWNLFGTVELWSTFVASPRLVWFLEIGLIVVGHVIAVLAAHRTAVRLAPSDSAAAKSQYALTFLMSVYTITTLWLLAQPLVTEAH